MPIPPGVVDSGQINKREVVVSILKKLKNDLGLNYVKVSLPEEKAYIFTAKIPVVTQDEIKSAIESKMEESVPVSPNELLFDYKLMEHGQEDYFIVAVSALPITLVDLYVDIFKEVDLSLLSLSVESQAVVRSLVPKVSRANLDTVLVVNFGFEKVGLYVAVDGVVHFTSTVSIKGDYSKNLELLSQEINKLFIYWHTLSQNVGNPKKKIKQIIVCGEGFKEEIIPYLTANSQTPVVLGNVWTNVFDINDSIPDISFNNSLGYATSIGLALPSSVLIQE